MMTKLEHDAVESAYTAALDKAHKTYRADTAGPRQIRDAAIDKARKACTVARETYRTDATKAYMALDAATAKATATYNAAVAAWAMGE